MYVIEKLTAHSWAFYIFPYFLEKSRQTLRLYYIDATRPGLWLFRLTAKFIKADIERLNFNLFDVRDQVGDLWWLKIIFEDLTDVQKVMCNHPEFQEIIKRYATNEKLRLFLMRSTIFLDSSLLKFAQILLLFRVVSLKADGEGEKTVNLFLFSSQRPWLTVLGQWAKNKNVNIIPMKRRGFSIKEMVMRSDGLKNAVKQMMYGWMKIKHRMRVGNNQGLGEIAKDTSPKMAVEFYGFLNLDFPGLNSDLFFCQQSNVLNKDVLIYFQHPAFPASDQAWAEIKRHGMSAVVINPRATTTPQIPLFNYHSKKIKEDCPKNADIAAYHQQRDYWFNFFTRHKIKVHVSWYKSGMGFYPMADALQSAGGVSVIYQRSLESDPTPWTVTAADVVFGFSRLGAHLGKDTDSIIPYYVVTGYLGDYRFPLLRAQANDIRHGLQSHGAKKILAYFDENSVTDPRWNIGHGVTQENYEYLLKKVIETPWLGLILKPKIISDLCQRLGRVSQLLCRAQETGRCYIFKEGKIYVSNPPAIAAMAADIAIHGHFFAATAGVEAALAGTPTLLLDREGFSKSSLYKLGAGRVIFSNWNELWKACLDHWQCLGTNPGFADWSPMIDEIDPFRDGRAAQRMAAYLEWLMEGFKADLPREVVLADAAQRYAKIWGKDKVFSVNWR